MSKKLFLSCYSKELAVALELKINLEYAFNHDRDRNNDRNLFHKLDIVSPLEELKCGDDWQNYIKEQLEDCDGLISLITPAYTKRAWHIAEFIPFWMAGKKVFPVTIGFEDNTSDIFRLITDKHQTARLEDWNEVQGLLERIGEFCEASRPDLKWLDEIVNNCNRKYNSLIAEAQGIDSDKEVFASNRFIRKYIKHSTFWDCSLNKNAEGVLSAVCNKEISFISASDDTKYIEMPLRALSEEGIAFEVIEAEANGKRVSIGSLTKKEESVFTYRVNFKPALNQGETVTIKYKVTVPQYKLATTEKALDLIKIIDRIERRNEYISFRVDAPTDEFMYRIVFTPECSVTPHEVQAKWNNTVDTEELEYIRTNKCYSNRFDAALGCILELSRKKLKPGITYTFSWELPSKEDIQ